MRTFFLILITGGLYLLILPFKYRKRKPDLLLVTLTTSQIQQAKVTNGKRKKITHAVVCSHYGQMFGTELQCRKYFSVWSQIFVPSLFARAIETDSYRLEDFETTFDLINLLIAAEDLTSGGL